MCEDSVIRLDNSLHRPPAHLTNSARRKPINRTRHIHPTSNMQTTVQCLRLGVRIYRTKPQKAERNARTARSATRGVPNGRRRVTVNVMSQPKSIVSCSAAAARPQPPARPARRKGRGERKIERETVVPLGETGMRYLEHTTETR